jgi:hypothetical protein
LENIAEIKNSVEIHLDNKNVAGFFLECFKGALIQVVDVAVHWPEKGMFGHPSSGSSFTENCGLGTRRS